METRQSTHKSCHHTRARFVLPPGSEVIDLRKRERRLKIAEIAKELGAAFPVTLENMERAFWSITTYVERHHPNCTAYVVAPSFMDDKLRGKPEKFDERWERVGRGLPMNPDKTKTSKA